MHFILISSSDRFLHWVLEPLQTRAHKTLGTNCRPAIPLDWAAIRARRSRSTLQLRRQSLSFAFGMTPDAAIQFLKRHQPMPSDHDITDEDGATFAAILKLFEEQPDRRAIPLLMRSVSKGTGLGMYEHIKFVLLAHDRGEVIPHLRDALRSQDPGVLSRACWWACDVRAWELEDLVVPLLSHPDGDVVDSAQAFMELKGELAEPDR